MSRGTQGFGFSLMSSEPLAESTGANVATEQAD